MNHFDWLKIVMSLATSNQSALFKGSKAFFKLSVSIEKVSYLILKNCRR